MEHTLPAGIEARGIHPSTGYREAAKASRFGVRLTWRSKAPPTGLALSMSIGLVFLAVPLVSAAVFYSRHGSALPCLLAFGMLAPMLLVMMAPRVLFLFSKTEITSDGERLRVWHRPRRWDFERDVGVGELDELRVASRESHDAGQAPGWCVKATTASGELVLVDELASEAHARALRDLLSEHALRPRVAAAPGSR